MGGRLMHKTTTAWDAGLPDMPLDGLQPFDNELAGYEKDAAKELNGDRKHVRQTGRQVMLDARRLDNALTHIGRLPERGEAFHLVTAGGYSLWHIVKATQQLAAPATIARLSIATLGFSRQNLEELAAAMDAGQIGAVDFLYSLYFKSNEREVCERLTHELTSRVARVLAMRTHCKMILMELSDGRTLVVESSANLRSNGNIENVTMIHDRPLIDFRAGWLNSLFTESEQ
jgi:hypothetical protein